MPPHGDPQLLCDGCGCEPQRREDVFCPSCRLSISGPRPTGPVSERIYLGFSEDPYPLTSIPSYWSWKFAEERRKASGHASRARRRARMRNAAGHASPQAIAARIAYYDAKCWICAAPYEAIDHVKPLARGGSNWPANLRPICRSCNSRKGGR